MLKVKSKYVFLMWVLANIKQEKEAKNVEILLNKNITFHMHYTVYESFKPFNVDSLLNAFSIT